MAYSITRNGNWMKCELSRCQESSDSALCRDQSSCRLQLLDRDLINRYADRVDGSWMFSSHSERGFILSVNAWMSLSCLGCKLEQQGSAIYESSLEWGVGHQAFSSDPSAICVGLPLSVLLSTSMCSVATTSVISSGGTPSSASAFRSSSPISPVQPLAMR